MKRKYIITLLSIVLCCMAGMAATPAEMLGRCVERLQKATGIYAEFTMKAGGTSTSGTLRSKGTKFALTSSAGSTWYDGTDMWVYTPSSGEVTVWHPSKGELAESNPLLYLSTAADYNVSRGAGAPKGRTVLVLTPRRRNSGVKSVKLTLSDATSLPESIVVSAGSGTMTVTLRNLSLNATASDQTFRFPKSKYPKAKVSDLR